MSICELIIEHNRHGIVLLLKLFLETGHLVLGDLEAWPTIPLEGGGFGQSAQATDQSSRGHGHFVLALIGALDGDGQAIGDEQ